MERMTGVDAGYLYLETPTMHMHTLKVAIMDTEEMDSGEAFSFEHFTAELLGQLPQLPPLLRRVLPVPFALGHPLWVTDRPIDPARHLFQHRLEAPGGMLELEAEIGQIASTPLDRSRPLWELHVCDGLAGGGVAIVGKMHHALADGAAANALLANLIQASVSDGPRRPVSPARHDVVPSRARQAWLGLVDSVRQVALLPGLLLGTLTALVRLVAVRRRTPMTVPRPILDVPRASFNGPLDARRTFATCQLPLSEIKQVKQAHGVSLNDVVLAVVAGAMAAWMAERGEHLAKSLVAGVPVATDDQGAAPRLGGNRVSNLFTTLGTDIAAPHARLHAISRTATDAKLVQRTLGKDMLTDWVQFAPPGLLSLGMLAYSGAGLAGHHPAPFNVVVSNVPGPREPVTISGARLRDLYSVGPILEGIGLNITVWSYVDRMNVSLISCPSRIADLAPLVAQLRPSLDRLLDLKECSSR